MALPANGSTHLIPALLLIYRTRKDERLSWLSWLTCSGWFTHISGHPSAVGRAQDRESSPARDRRSTTVPRHQLDAQLVTDKTRSDRRAKCLVSILYICDEGCRTNAACKTLLTPFYAWPPGLHETATQCIIGLQLPALVPRCSRGGGPRVVVRP